MPCMIYSWRYVATSGTMSFEEANYPRHNDPGYESFFRDRGATVVE